MRVFESIQSAIKDKSLPPGRRVTEADLAAQLNVSKTPVREAFIKLRQIGLLEPDGRRAWRVIQLSRPTIDDACEVREALEVSAARAAAERATAEQREAISEAAERSLEAAGAGDKDVFRALGRSLPSRHRRRERERAAEGPDRRHAAADRDAASAGPPSPSGVDRVRPGARRDRGDHRERQRRTPPARRCAYTSSRSRSTRSATWSDRSAVTLRPVSSAPSRSSPGATLYDMLDRCRNGLRRSRDHRSTPFRIASAC